MFDIRFTQLLKKPNVPRIKFDAIRIRIINLLYMVYWRFGAIVELHQNGSCHGMRPPLVAFSTVFVSSLRVPHYTQIHPKKITKIFRYLS
jgi:hypothetical protein